MKRKVRISRPCMECGGSVPHMNQGGVNPMGVQAPEPVKESVVGMCTGTSFGGPDCPKGSQQYELALKFRKEQATKKKKEAPSVAEQGADIDSTTGKRNKAYKEAVANTATNVIAEEEMLRAASMPQTPMHQMPDGSWMPGAEHISRYGGIPEYFIGGIGPQTEQQWEGDIEYDQARYDQQFGVDGPMERIKPKPVVTDINAIIDAGQFKGTQTNKDLLAKDTDILEDKFKRKNKTGQWAKSKLGDFLTLGAAAGNQINYDDILEGTTHTDESFTANRDKEMGSIGFNDLGLPEDLTKYVPVQYTGSAPTQTTKYGGVPKYNLAGAVDYGYKANPFTKDLIQAQQDQQDSWGVIGGLGTSLGKADLTEEWKKSTKLVDNDRKDGVDVKKWGKQYIKDYSNIMDDSINKKKMFDMFNMFARYGGQRELPQAAYGWWDSLWGIDNSMSSKNRPVAGRSARTQYMHDALEPFSPFNLPNVQDMSGYDASMSRRAEDIRNTPEAHRGEYNFFTGHRATPNMTGYKTPITKNTGAGSKVGAAASSEENLPLWEVDRKEREAKALRRAIDEEKRRRIAEADNTAGDKATEGVKVGVKVGADAIEASRNKKKKKGTKTKTDKQEEGVLNTVVTEVDDPTYRGNAERSKEDTGTGDYNPNTRISYVDGVPFATDYTDTEIKYRNNWLRPNKRRVKSVKFTHGIRGNNNGPSGPGMQGDGQGAQAFDPNNPTPEQLAYIQQMMNVKNSSDPNDPINMLTDGTYDNMNVPEFGDDQPNMDPYNPNAWNRDYLSYGYGEDQTPIIPGKGPQAAGEYTDNYTPLDQANVDASYMEQVPVPEYVPTGRADQEAQEAYDQREAENNKAAMLQAESELDADLASQQYGGYAMYENGGNPPSKWDLFMQGLGAVTSGGATTAMTPTVNAKHTGNMVYDYPESLNSSRRNINEWAMDNQGAVVPAARMFTNNTWTPGRGRILKDAAVAAVANRQYGGDTTYQEGWEGEMTEDELQEFINGGGQVEFI